jgi:hypothetical protein
MQESQPLFDPGQQSKIQQLQLEVTALEEQVENVLKEQLKLTTQYDSHLPIPLIYVDDRFAKSGIRLTHETVFLENSELGVN